MHTDQLTITPAIVGALVRDQCPAWARLPVQPIASQGTVNAIFRIGDQLAARFPLRPAPADALRRTLEDEASRGRELAGCTRFPTPRPVALGDPGHGYPLPWSVQTWLPGTTATAHVPADSTAFAYDLAELIRDLRALDTRGRTFHGQGRGGDLTAHDAWMEICFERSAGIVDVDRLRALWARLRQLPRGSEPDVMSHSDLIPGNVLVAQGRLAGVLDVGGFGPADPALDLVAAWHLLAAKPRVHLREQLGCDDLQWQRGKAWAFQQAMGAAWYYRESNPAMYEMGVTTLGRLLADEAAGPG
jgi:aminoglycoside phosphotransferase (APT) family kinase protein